MSTGVISEKLLIGRKLATLRDKLVGAKSLSDQKTSYENQRKEAHADALIDLIELDGVNGPGVRFQYGDKELAAFACQADAGKVWKVAELTKFLKAQGLWTKATTTQPDPKKLAEMMAADPDLARELEQFQEEGEPPAAYVKFINPKPDSK